MTRPDTDLLADRPQPLPIIVRPQRDETLNSYLRRLAQANHLRPSQLRQYLCAPPGYQGSVRAARLAAVTNRSVQALTRHFADLQVETRTRVLADPKPHPDKPAQRRTIANLAKKRGQNAARELLAAIRAEAHANPSLRSITRKFRVHADTVLLALITDPDETTKSRRPRSRRERVFDPYTPIIDDLMAREPTITRWEIWERLVDEHGAELSYGSVRDYIRDKVRSQTVPRRRKTEKPRRNRSSGADQLRNPGRPDSHST